MNENQRRYDNQQADKLLDGFRGYGPGRNDIFAWGFIIGGVLGSVLGRTMQDVLLWAFGGLAVSFVLRMLGNLLSRD